MEVCVVCADLTSNFSHSSCGKCFVCIQCNADLALAPEIILTCSCQHIICISAKLFDKAIPDYNTYLNDIKLKLKNSKSFITFLTKTINIITKDIPDQISAQLKADYGYLSPDILGLKTTELVTAVNTANEPYLKHLKIVLDQVRPLLAICDLAVSDHNLLAEHSTDLTAFVCWYYTYEPKLRTLDQNKKHQTMPIYQVYFYRENIGYRPGLSFNYPPLQNIGFISHSYDKISKTGVKLDAKNNKIECHFNDQLHGRCQHWTKDEDNHAPTFHDQFYHHGVLVSSYHHKITAWGRISIYRQYRHDEDIFTYVYLPDDNNKYISITRKYFIGQRKVTLDFNHMKHSNSFIV